MYWAMSDVEPALRREYGQLHATGAAALTPSYLDSRHRPGLLWGLVFVGSAIAGLLAWGLVAGLREYRGGNLAGFLAVLTPFALLAAGWAACLWREALGALRSQSRPFVLITPALLLEADYDHGVLGAFSLKDATGFKSVEEYKRGKFSGRRFLFTFPEGERGFLLKAPEAIRRCEAVIARAREPGASGLYMPPLPAPPGSSQRPRREKWIRPFGEFWLIVGGVLAVGLMAIFVIARMTGQ